jgi:uncharacterized protein (TIGR02300 family)
MEAAFPNSLSGASGVAKPDLGTKRVCQSCGAKFYDLSKDPIVCPKCDTVYEIVVPTARGGRPAAAAAAAAAAVPVADEVDVAADAEVISLEDADAEKTSTKAKAATLDPELETDEDVEVEGDDEEDNTFLVTDEEEEGGDVSDIIGDGIDKEEET